jgi:hypothetical protein
MTQTTNELQFRTIKSSIKKFGDFEKSIEINPIDISGEIGYSYKINESLVSDVIKEMRDTIEKDAQKRGIKVLQIK